MNCYFMIPYLVSGFIGFLLDYNKINVPASIYWLLGAIGGALSVYLGLTNEV